MGRADGQGLLIPPSSLIHVSSELSHLAPHVQDVMGHREEVGSFLSTGCGFRRLPDANVDLSCGERAESRCCLGPLPIRGPARRCPSAWGPLYLPMGVWQGPEPAGPPPLVDTAVDQASLGPSGSSLLCCGLAGQTYVTAKWRGQACLHLGGPPARAPRHLDRGCPGSGLGSDRIEKGKRGTSRRGARSGSALWPVLLMPKQDKASRPRLM